MWICTVCERLVDVPKQEPKWDVARDAPRCDNGHVLLPTVGSNWEGFAVALLSCLLLWFISLIPAFIGVRDPLIVGTCAMMLGLFVPFTIFLFGLWRAFRFRSRRDPVNRLSRHGIWVAAGVAFYWSLLALVGLIQRA